MKTILCIEDEQALQKAMGDILTSEGYKSISALNGEIGLQLAKKEKPDLILLDLILPKKDGFEVLQALKEDKETENIPVIVLTNLEQMKDIDRVIKLGGTNYLIKSNYTLEEVLRKIKKALGEE